MRGSHTGAAASGGVPAGFGGGNLPAPGGGVGNIAGFGGGNLPAPGGGGAMRPASGTSTPAAAAAAGGAVAGGAAGGKAFKTPALNLVLAPHGRPHRVVLCGKPQLPGTYSIEGVLVGGGAGHRGPGATETTVV